MIVIVLVGVVNVQRGEEPLCSSLTAGGYRLLLSLVLLVCLDLYLLPEGSRWSRGPEVSSGQHHQTQLDSIFKFLEKDIFTFVQKELKKLHKVLSTDYPECLEPLKDEDEEQRSSSEAVLKITLNFLRRMKQKELAECLWSRTYSGVCGRKLKCNLQQKFECVFEGIAKAGNPTLLKQIYTELYITEGGSSEVNQEHEVRHMETASRKPGPAETAITCEDIFKGPADTDGCEASLSRFVQQV
ncbi:uncharacterized protein [Eucyclogobius newberryi]|uniref:uncharacterized protein n=1 Tax=Eucyclogobius newberryi TaxID=166745 RepID=UPI003B59E3E7